MISWGVEKETSSFLSPRPTPSIITPQKTAAIDHMQKESAQAVDRGRLTWSLHTLSIYWARKDHNDKWTLNSWNSSLSPQSVTLAPCIFRTHSKGALWDTDLTQSTWIDFISHSALFRGSPVVCYGDLKQNWVSLTDFVLQSWAMIDSSVYPVNGPCQLLHPCLFFHLLSPFPHIISLTFSPPVSHVTTWLWMMARLRDLEEGRPQTKYVERMGSCNPGDRKVSLHTDLLTGQEPPLEQAPVEVQKTLGLTNCNDKFWEVKRSTFWMDTQES